MEDNYDKEFKFFEKEPITDYDLGTLFIEHDKTTVPPETKKEIIKENKRVKAKIRKRLMGKSKVAATDWKGFPTPTKGAIDKKGKLIPRTSPVYKTLDLEDEAIKFTDRLTVPKNTPMTPRFQMYREEGEDQKWRLLPKDRLKDLQYMAKGGPAVMGIPVPDKKKKITTKKQGTKRKRPGGKRRRKRKTRKKRKSRRKKTRKKRRRKKRRTKKR
tara:strand:- start:28 stop:669 length:642 start_codon:yes stop_codon:yes gene_type:complete